MVVNQLIRRAAVTALVILASFAASASAQTARDTKAAISDGWITTQIYAKYFADPDVKGRNIDVSTTGGVVTLTGEVHSAAEHTQVVAKAKATEGVKQVVDKLTVAPAGRQSAPANRDRPAPSQTDTIKAQAKTAADRVGKEISDTWITTKVQAMYFLDKEVKGMDIDVTTQRGVVTLSGTVDSEAARQKAIADARSTEGVKQVVDKLAVRK